MLFISTVFIFLFLPITLLCYFFLNKKHFVVFAKMFLIFASLYFYGYWNIKYVPIIITSVIINFAIGSILNSEYNIKSVTRKWVLFWGIAANLALLGYYKYADFFITNVNFVFGLKLDLLHILLPLGISFFTFQQISYLIDSYRKETKEYDFLNYALFVTFFPQLIAGPIVRHKEMMPQFQKAKTKVFNWKNFTEGLFLFIIGLSKKVIIADTVAKWATAGFDGAADLTAIETWLAMLSYTFQIYYDFSGYTDMALGLGKMFNIKLPINFNNPYQAISIEDFWRRWHISLSRFLKDYLYKPFIISQLKHSNNELLIKSIAIMIVFFVSGLWHGAGWLFVIWGLSHGIVNVINKLLREYNINIPKGICWILTFIYLNITWVFFRSENIQMAKNVLSSAFGANGFVLPKFYGTEILYKTASIAHYGNWTQLIVLFVLIICIFFPVLRTLAEKFKPNGFYLAIEILLFIICLGIILEPNLQSPFIYFNF